MIKIDSYRLKQLIADGTVKNVIKLDRFPKYLKGKTYWSGYWQKWYKVLSVEIDRTVKPNRMKSVTIQWEDGRLVNHCTRLDSDRDFEIVI